jgi:hypothetical protein
MAYLVFGDVRPDSAAEFASQLTLSESDVGDDAAITSAIARMSQRIDDVTNDHFESETVTLELDGDGTDRLMLPKRCTAVTTIKTRDSAAVLTTQAATVYRLHSSLYSTGSKRLEQGGLDWVDIVPLSAGLSLSLEGPWAWPCGPQTVQVVGTFGWTTTPGDIKRLTALLVYDHFKPIRSDLRRTDQFTTPGGERVLMADTDPFGIPEADDIVASYRRVNALPVF